MNSRFERLAVLAGCSCLCCVLTVPLQAGTLTLDAGQCDRMAVIDQNAPRLSWASSAIAGGEYSTTSLVLQPGRGFLIHFDLSQIPAGQRIASAELLVPVSGAGGSDPRFFVWRLVSDWGLGVCWDNSMQKPAKQAWAVPGARGPGLDRSLKPSAVVRETQARIVQINVTEDVALWQAKAAPQQGWMFTVEDPGTWFSFRAPFWDAASQWTLQITYEPEVGE